MQGRRHEVLVPKTLELAVLVHYKFAETSGLPNRISKKSNLHPGHLIYLIPQMPKIVTRIQAALVAPHVSPDVPL